MGSLSQLAEDILTCPLCLEKVREPRTLPCLHAFCRYCLSAYVRQTVSDWRFPCPLCAQDTRPPARGLSVDQWLETFPTSNFLHQVGMDICTPTRSSNDRAVQGNSERLLV